MRRKRILAILFLACMFSGLILSKTLFASNVDEEKKKQQKMEKELADSEGMLLELENLKSDTNAYIKALDEKLDTLTESIHALNIKMEEKQAEIEQANLALVQKQQEADEQYAAMKIRIQYIFENGNSYYLDMILESNTLGDFLNRVEYITEISKYDRNMLDKLNQTQKDIATTKKTLEDDQQALARLKTQTEAENASVQALVDSKTEQLNVTQQKIASTKDEVTAQQQEILDQQELVMALEEAEKQQEILEANKKKAEEESKKALQTTEKKTQSNVENQENIVASNNSSSDDNKTNEESNQNEKPSSNQSTASTEKPTEKPTEAVTDSSTDNATFCWPVPNYRRISDYFGYRLDPFGSSQTVYHSGLDISANYGSEILAAADGTVLWARYSTTAGNWIGIRHNSELTTVYMHTSKMLVSPGDKVSKGQVIALVGSTGSSTGNHLHFGVSLNSKYVNPQKYLPQKYFK